MTLTLRPVTDADKDFLFDVYASTRRDEVGAWGWDLAQQDAFLKLQFTAQFRSYEMQYTHASHDIIFLNEEAVGRLLVARSENEIHLVDISLLAEKRGKGLGTVLLDQLIEEGKASNRPVRLEVLKDNPAARLYERAGFRVTSENGLYLQMERQPE